MSYDAYEFAVGLLILAALVGLTLSYGADAVRAIREYRRNRKGGAR
jgi:hypothetical protein